MSGSITEARRSGKVKGRAFVAFRFHTLALGDDHYRIHTTVVSREAKSTKKEDAKKIGIGAAGGAIIGGIIGGRKGLGVGTAVGAGAGTGVVMATSGDEVRLTPGTAVQVSLTEPITIRVPIER